MKIHSYLLNASLALVSVFVAFFVFDYLFVVINPQWSGDNRLSIRKADKSYLFELVPNVSGHNSLGLRGPEIEVEKPKDVYRIIVLGDSVTYGLFVDASQAFPARIELFLTDKQINGKRIEVINAGVPAFTAYNELHFYEDMLKYLNPDLVILGFCMNDVVDPFFHWSDLGEPDLVIPTAAIPNEDYHAEQLRNDKGSFIIRLLPDWSNLKRFFVANEILSNPLESKTDSDGIDHPVYLALEQPMNIDVYNDYQSQEWQWLKRQIKALSESLKSEKTDFLFVIFPLAYQLDASYPFSPSANFEKFCKELELACLDLLDSMKGQPVDDLFISNRAGFFDVWHLTAKGHRKVAREIIGKRIQPRYINPSKK